MMYFDLPKTLAVGGKDWRIRSDFRVILSVISAFEDPDLQNEEKVYVCLHNIYEDFETMPSELYQDAFTAAMGFIDHSTGKGRGVKNMDWEQDANLLFPAVNHVAGYEVRGVEYLHWWTFLGYFMEIGEGIYSTVLSLRNKKNSKKKFEEWEKDWWVKNYEICKLKKRYSTEEMEQQRKIIEKLGG